MRKPRVITRCVASHYDLPDERTIEFAATVAGRRVGGLISLRPSQDGRLTVHLHQCDPEVEVFVNYRAGKEI